MFRSPPVDLIVILVIVLLIVGPKKLPQMGRGLGQGMREFKEGITGESKDEDKPALSEARAMPETKPSSTEPAATSGSATSGSGAAGPDRTP
jgi:sec-independent protein translocase protein TatA